MSTEPTERLRAVGRLLAAVVVASTVELLLAWRSVWVITPRWSVNHFTLRGYFSRIPRMACSGMYGSS